jgi:hypothetical protein
MTCSYLQGGRSNSVIRWHNLFIQCNREQDTHDQRTQHLGVLPSTSPTPEPTPLLPESQLPEPTPFTTPASIPSEPLPESPTTSTRISFAIAISEYILVHHDPLLHLQKQLNNAAIIYPPNFEYNAVKTISSMYATPILQGSHYSMN